MKKIAVIVFVAGFLALSGVLGYRFLVLSQSTSTLESPPGEERLEHINDTFVSLFRSWALGGKENNTEAQEEAILRLGSDRKSEPILLELRRRNLEQQLLEAKTMVEQARNVAMATETGDLTEEQVEFIDEDATDSEEEIVEPDMDDSATTLSTEEAKARESLSNLEMEYEKLLTALKPETLAKEKIQLAEIAVLSGGASRGVQTLLAGWGQPFRIVSMEELSGLDSRLPLLIIPSGALTPKASGAISGYVRSGGTVLCLAQPHGKDFASLPGGIRGFGWSETESDYDDALEVAAAHPATASCQNPRFSGWVDGFLTDLPKESEVLLRATQNRQTAAVTYPLGKGRMIVTTLFTDWVMMTKSPGEAENRFLRDVTLWAASVDHRLNPEIVSPGAKFKINISIANNTKEMAKKVKVAYLTPEGRRLTPFDLDLRVLPGETEEKKLTITAPKTPGIWRLVYALDRPDGTMLQYWRNAADFISGKPAVAPAPSGLGAAVVTQHETFHDTKKVPLSLYLWNYDSIPITAQCTGPAGQEKITVPAGGDRKAVFQGPVPEGVSGRSFYEFLITHPGGKMMLSKMVRTVQTTRKEDGSK